MRLFILQGGHPSGPHSIDVVLYRIRCGELGGDDEIWLEGSPHVVSVAELLGSRPAEMADEALFNRFKQPAYRPYRRNREEGTWWEVQAGMVAAGVTALIPGMGLLSGLGGGGLVALVLSSCVIWGIADNRRQGGYERDFETLRQKIVLYVNAHPHDGVHSWQQLRKAGAVNDADQALMERTHSKFHPISAASPRDALVLLRPSAQMEKRYYKDLPSDFVMWWPSDDNRYAVVSRPQYPGAKSRHVSFRNEKTGEILWQRDVEGFAVFPRWRRDGRYVALQESRPGCVARLRLYAVVDNHVRECALPVEILPQQFLKPDRGLGEPHWQVDQTNMKCWRDDGILMVESYGLVVYRNEQLQRVGKRGERRAFGLQPRSDGPALIATNELLALRQD